MKCPSRNRLLGFGTMVFLCCLPACGNLGPTGGHRGQFIVTLTSLSPSSVMASGPAFALTVYGTNLTGGYATLVWNGGQQIQSVGAGHSSESTQATFIIDTTLIVDPGTVSIAVIDGINANQLSNALTLTITPPGNTACALFGMYDFLYTGFAGGPELIAGSFGVDASGNVLGQEECSAYPFSIHYSDTMTGKCTSSAIANQGTVSFTLNPPAGATTSYTFVVQQGGSGPQRGRLVADTSSPSNVPGSGVLVATPLTSVLEDGDYVFGLVGSDPHGGGGLGSQESIVGRFTCTNGTVSAGVADVNDGGTVTTDVPVTGTAATAPSMGLTTPEYLSVNLNLTIGGAQVPLSVRVNSSGGGLAYSNGLVGFLSPQTNAGTYDNASLNAPFVFSTWGAPSPLFTGSTYTSSSVTTLGLSSGFDSDAGTFNLQFDNVSGGVSKLNQTVTGATYSVASNGRATVSYTSGGSMQNYVYYLDGANDGYILGLGNTAEFGFFQPQAAGPFTAATINGAFASATFLPLVPASPNLATEITLNNGNLSANTPSGALTGTYSVAASGRGTASVNLPVLGGKDLVFYVIGPASVVMMGSDNTASDAITFMHL